MRDVKPLGDRVLVELAKTKDMEGRFAIPDKAQTVPTEGIVVALGKGKRTATGRLLFEFPIRARVIVSKYGGTQFDADNPRLRIYNAKEILATVSANDGVTTLTPIGNRALFMPTPSATKSAWGILLPESALTKTDDGIVFAVGRGKVNDDGTVTPLPVFPGDKVIVKHWAGHEVTVDGQVLKLVEAEDILGVVTPEVETMLKQQLPRKAKKRRLTSGELGARKMIANVRKLVSPARAPQKKSK